MPFIAEGGGFMYLHECLQGDDERYYPMCGVIEGKCHKTSRPQNFGYINMLADSGNMLFRAGDKVNAHSFHYWSSDSPKASLTLKKPGRDRQWKETACGDSFYGGMPHLFFRGNPDIIKRFVWRCAEWKN
ncbi:MAG: cobyrinic acid a,c-diamide synthase, partial [Eubacterium sp.]|jgi:cobyrinic acid a,c-diamide synthase|nr:cobyrinic acid a,c-diamide synthase [Eubacterium sp.]